MQARAPALVAEQMVQRQKSPQARILGTSMLTCMRAPTSPASAAVY